jgi:hypothetical protein
MGRLVFLILSGGLLFGCGGQTISCDSSDAKDLVKQLILDNTSAFTKGFLYGSSYPDPSKYPKDQQTRSKTKIGIPDPTLELINIRVSSKNENTNTVSCKSDVRYTFSDDIVEQQNLSKPITSTNYSVAYTVQPTTDGNIYVTLNEFFNLTL